MLLPIAPTPLLPRRFALVLEDAAAPNPNARRVRCMDDEE